MTTTDGNARRMHASRRNGRRSAVYAAVLALAMSAVLVATPSSVPVSAQTPGLVSNVTELYEAVDAANKTTGATITIAAGEYQLTTPLVIRGLDTRIEGAAKPVGFDSDTRAILAGEDATVIRGTEQAFIIDANDVTISGVAITGADGGRKSGGAIAVNRNRTGFVLSQSTIVANSASEGAGVFVERNAAATIEGSTFVGNTTAGKGGGVRVAGSVDVVNSTFTDNAAQSGGAVSVAGSAAISYSTFVDNNSNNSKGGGVDRNGGTLALTGSILTQALQSGSDGSDCSGTPNLVGTNFVGNAQGCNPGPNTLTRAIAGSLLLGPLGDNGGPTQTIAQLDGSPAINAGPTVCRAVTSGQTTTDEPNGTAITNDQRGLMRPSIAADDTPTPCDLGAYEQSSLGVEAALTVDTSRYQARNYAAGTVEVGTVSVPTSRIAFELATRTPTNPDGTVNTAGLRSIGLRSIGLRSITLEDIGLRSIDLEAAGLRSIDVKASGLRSIGLRSIGLRSIGLRSIGLRSIGLRSIGLRSIPLSEIPLLENGGWSEFLQGTEFADVPLQSITLEDITGLLPDGVPDTEDEFTLESIDLSSTGLRSIGLRSIALAGIELRSIPLPVAAGETDDGNYAPEWCNLLFGADLCADPDFVLDVGDLELWEAQLFGADIDQEEILEVPLSGLNDALIEEGLASTGLRSIGLRSIGLRSIFLENTGLRSIGLRSIGLRSIADSGSIDGLGTIIDCLAPGDPCSTAETNTVTLGDVVAGCLPPELIGEPGYTDPENCLLKTGATLGDLFDLLAIPFDEDGDADAETLLHGLNLFDILFAFVAPEDVPWEAIELDGALLQNIADPLQPTFDYLTEVTVREGPADLDVVLNLPNGFAVATPVALDPTTTTTWCPVGATTCTDAITPQQPLALGNPTYAISGVPSGTYVLKVPVRAGLTVGQASDACSLEDLEACAFPTMVTVTAVGPNGAPPPAVAGPVDVTVVEASSGGPGKAPLLDDGELQLGHITSNGDLDVYRFTVTDSAATGSSARVLLSNIPEGVDYDLSVYGPRPDSLRGTPTDARSALVEASFDLNPDDDVLPTDVVDDIAVDINAIANADPGDEFSLPVDDAGKPVAYALRDISSRRSNNDEEVTIPAVVANETYIIAVSAYYDDLSPEPYGLRVRLDGRTAIPECAARTAAYPAPVAAGTNPLPVVNGVTNTLYVTNLSRLAAENGGSVADVAQQVFGAKGVDSASGTGIVGTDGVNEVRAGILQVDDLPAWDTWNDDRCNPDARNAVVSAIGAEIDKAVNAQGSKIEHIVLVGGDGVIPMAAVPDLTEYSNESTFARELLTSDGKSNEAVAALASGYLLSDDPYATDAGIAILGGDHELYLPERSIGRLVETTGEIAGQLDNFATFSGTLDPGTFNASAAVTAYDFLDDGGDAIADALRAGGFEVDQLTDAVPLWDRKAYLDLLAGVADPITGLRSGIDRKIVSPNAHYDFESLLPAAPDDVGYFTDAQLVTTGDVAELGDGFDSLVFTVGCHAGFSVSDVQLQHPALDWAQLNAQNTNQFVAHTTYGYGDTTIVAYSERLAQLFAQNVAAMTDPAATSRDTLGQAVRDAKERYLAGTLVLTPYDEKILQSWTYYGLPMYTLGDIAGPAASDATEKQTVSFLELAGATTLEATIPLLAGPASFVIENNTTTVDIDLSGDALELVPVDEDRDGTPDSSYYQVDGNAIVAQYRPVQPLVDVEIPVTGTYQGFLVTGLTSEDLPETYIPFYSNPLIDNSANETRIVVGDGAFPATLQRVNDVTDGQRLLVAAGEYESGQRLFRRISGELIPRTKTGDDVAARFLDVVGLRVADVGGTGQGVQFDVVTDDDALRAVVLFREFGTTQWRPVELAGQAAAGGARRWFGSAPLLTSGNDVEFFVQNVDDAGNVGISRNKIENFSTSDADDPGDPSLLGIEYVGPLDKEFAGRYYPSEAVFKIVGGKEATQFTVDSGPPLAYNLTNGITIRYVEGATGAYNAETGVLELDRGPHVLFAKEGDSRVYRFFILDPDAPTVTFSPASPAWTSGEVEITIVANDASGAGVASIAYCVDTVEPAAPVCTSVTDTSSTTVTVSTAGVTTITAVATDRVGNESTGDDTEVWIDRTGPTVSFSPDTEAWSADDVTVAITATDEQSGVKSITSCLDPPLESSCTAETVTAGNVANVAVTTEEGRVRTARIAAVAEDQVGNKSAGSTTVRIDKARPTIPTFTITPDADGDGFYSIGETVSTDIGCDDVGSGVATCQLLVDGVPATTIDTSRVGTSEIRVRAVDNVGNEFTSEVITVTVAYGICLLYDPTQEKNIGSNYTIKLRLCDSQGRNLSARNITLTALTVDLNLDPGPNFSGKANDGYEFRYNASDASYIYNLDTTRLEAGPHLLYFTTRQVPMPRPADPNVLNTYIDAAPAPFALR